MSQDKGHLRVRYEYEENPEARIQYAHGVWGGINPQWEIEMNFYTESDRMPAFSERIIAPDGSLDHEITPGDEEVKVICRRIHSRLILNYHTARSVLEWLQDKVEALEEESGDPVFFDDTDENGTHQ